jgi:hypothetical protein
MLAGFVVGAVIVAAVTLYSKAFPKKPVSSKA